MKSHESPCTFVFYYTGIFCYTSVMSALGKNLLLLFLIAGCRSASVSPTSGPVSTTIPTQTSVPLPAPEDWWHPTTGLTWQWQLSDLEIDTSIEADVFDVDLEVDPTIIDRLHSQGRK